MVLHFLVLLTKLKLILLGTSSSSIHACSSSSSVVAASMTACTTTRVTSTLPLVFLFILRIPLIRDMRRQYYTDVLNACRFFVFRLGRILLRDDELNYRDSPRWVRALRLVRERAMNNTAQRRHPSAVQQSYEDSLHAVSMLAL